MGYLGQTPAWDAPTRAKSIKSAARILATRASQVITMLASVQAAPPPPVFEDWLTSKGGSEGQTLCSLGPASGEKVWPYLLRIVLIVITPFIRCVCRDSVIKSWLTCLQIVLYQQGTEKRAWDSIKTEDFQKASGYAGRNETAEACSRARFRGHSVAFLIVPLVGSGRQKLHRLTLRIT